MAGRSDVIDWNAALQQCGDDEEFLKEVLADLQTETEAQLSNIAATIQVCLCAYLIAIDYVAMSSKRRVAHSLN